MIRNSLSKRIVGALLLSSLLVAASGCGGSEQRKAQHVEKGQAFLAERNYAKARVEFRNALQIDPKDAAARTLLGRAAEGIGEYEEAVRNYRYALALDEKQVEARAHLARMLVLAGLPDRALELVEPGLELTPQTADLLSVRAAAPQQQGDFAAARNDAEAALRIDPAHSGAVAVLASLMWRDGDRQPAIELVRKAATARPKK